MEKKRINRRIFWSCDEAAANSGSRDAEYVMCFYILCVIYCDCFQAADTVCR